jgi:hypothetical protein
MWRASGNWQVVLAPLLGSLCPAASQWELTCISPLLPTKTEISAIDFFAYYLLHAGFLLGLFFVPKGVGDIFL